MARLQGPFPAELPPVPAPDPSVIAVEDGYKVEVVASGLEYPSAIEFDDRGGVYLSLSGYVYGDPVGPGQVIYISNEGLKVVFDQVTGPINGLLFHQGKLYVSRRGAISMLDPDTGVISNIVTDLPSFGDHHNNQLTVGPDGRLYFGQGTVTNSGVVGLDNAYPFMWLLERAHLHDVPAFDVRLRGKSYVTPQANNVLAQQSLLTNLPRILANFVGSIFRQGNPESLLVSTGAFQPFGSHIKGPLRGEVKANGTIMAVNPDGTGLAQYASGFRNPYGTRWYNNELYVTDLGYDERGSRPIANAPDVIWKVTPGAWHGFPDYAGGIPVTDARFKPVHGPRPSFLLQEHPQVAQPYITLPPHSSPGKFDFSNQSNFGHVGSMFVAMIGTGYPVTAISDIQPPAFKVMRIGADKQPVAFAANRPEASGPPGFQNYATMGFRTPVECRFSPDGQSLYVVDIGAIYFGNASAGPLTRPNPRSGVLWRITRA
jgi:glucose/arabinose dehydrogenase